MEPPLQHIGSSNVQGYKALMHDLIIEAILHHHVTFDTLKSYLSDFNVEIYHDLCEKAITYYDMFATKNIKSSGHEHVRARLFVVNTPSNPLRLWKKMCNSDYLYKIIKIIQ